MSTISFQNDLSNVRGDFIGADGRRYTIQRGFVPKASSYTAQDSKVGLLASAKAVSSDFRRFGAAQRPTFESCAVYTPFICPTLSVSSPAVMRVATENLWKGESAAAVKEPKEFIKGSSRDAATTQEVLFGPLALNATEFIASTSGIVRDAHDSYTLLGGSDDPVALSALAVTSGFNLISGPLNIYDGVQEWRSAQKANDLWEKTLAGQQLARGAAQVGAGASLLSARCLMIAADSNNSRILDLAAKAIAPIGVGFANILFVLSMLKTSCKIYEAREVFKRVDALLADPSLPEEKKYAQCLQVLKNQLHVTPEEKIHMHREVESQALTPLERKAKIEEREQQLLCKKELVLTRVLDADCVDKIKNATAKNAKEVVQAVKETHSQKMRASYVIMGLTILSAIGLILGLIFTAGIPLIIGAAISMIASIGFLVLDGSQLWQQFKMGAAGRYDHLWIFLSTVVCFVAVSAAFLLAGGLPALIAAAVVGAVWLGINTACLIRLRNREQELEIMKAWEAIRKKIEKCDIMPSVYPTILNKVPNILQRSPTAPEDPSLGGRLRVV